MPRPRLSIWSGMILVAILAFNFAVVGSAVRAGRTDGHAWANVIVAFGFLVGVQFFGPLAILGLFAILGPGRGRRGELIPGVLLFWALFVPCAAAVIQILIYGR